MTEDSGAGAAKTNERARSPQGPSRPLGPTPWSREGDNCVEPGFHDDCLPEDRAPGASDHAKLRLADDARRLGRFQQALTLYREVVRSLSATAPSPATFDVYATLTDFACERHNSEEAFAWLDHAARVADRLDDPARQQTTALLAAACHLACDDAARAQPLLEAALPVLRRQGTTGLVVKAHMLLGQCHIRNRADARAVDVLGEALALAKTHGVREMVARVMRHQAELSILGNALASARTTLDAALPLTLGAFPVQEAKLFARLAIVDARDGRWRSARANLRAGRQAVPELDVSWYPFELAELVYSTSEQSSTTKADLGARLESAAAWGPFEHRLVACLRDEVSCAKEPGRASREGRQRLAVSSDGSWFETERSGRVFLSERLLLRNILLALVRQRRQGGHSLGVHDLFDQCWEEAYVHPDIAASRVYVAISDLRRAGLRGILLHRKGGYVLHPAFEVEIVTHPETETPAD